MLDGGIKKWKKENLPIETKSNSFQPSIFSGKTNPDLISGFDYIQDNLNTKTIIDSRSEGEYNGTIIRAAQGGHIPNSINIDWTKNIDEDGTFNADDFQPWIDEGEARRKGVSTAELAESTASLWKNGLAGSGIGPPSSASQPEPV